MCSISYKSYTYHTGSDHLDYFPEPRVTEAAPGEKVVIPIETCSSIAGGIGWVPSSVSPTKYNDLNDRLDNPSSETNNYTFTMPDENVAIYVWCDYLEDRHPATEVV